MSREQEPARSTPAGESPGLAVADEHPALQAYRGLPPGYLAHYGLQRKPAERAPQPPVQLDGPGNTAITASQLHDTAAQGVAGGGGALPFLDRIQGSFGGHDVSSVQAHTDGQAASAANAIGAQAYATGNHVAFGSTPDLHTAAHEAAHVVQQRGGVQLKGGVGEAGDSYERHADAVADRVVQGRSASDLLDAMAPAGEAGAAGEGVQRKVLQLDIKADLRKAMSGWGTDESAIFARIQRASLDELQAVVKDAALMRELRSELSGSDMKRVLDMLQAPLSYKLRLAIEGWGTDEQYIWDSIARAPVGELSTAVRDTALFREVESDLNGAEQDRFRTQMARRIHLEGHEPELAFWLLQGSSDAMRNRRLALYGGIAEQRALCDAVIGATTDATRAIQAFQSYWGVECQAVSGATMAQWSLPVLRNIHNQLKALPAQDTRSGVWQRLALSNASQTDNTGAEVGMKVRAGWNSGSGTFTVGTQASPNSTTEYGYGTTLTADSAANATSLQVNEPNRLAVNSSIAVGTGADRDTATISAISGNTYTVTALAHAHYTGDRVAQNDATGERDVNWLAATVRHEIAHSVETAMGGVTGFTVGLGGWWTGGNPASAADFDTWAGQMASPWQTNDSSVISDADKATIKTTIVDYVANQKGTLTALPATHVVQVNLAKNVPVIMAAERCLSRGDGFFQDPASLYGSGGKKFSTSYWYRRFMYHNDSIVNDRVKDYQMFAPTEFFAEAYTVFYEEAGMPGVTEADYGRLIKNSSWRDWIRTNVHNRGLAPAGTGAATGGGGSPAQAGGGAQAQGGAQQSAGAKAGGASFGKSAGNPGP